MKEGKIIYFDRPGGQNTSAVVEAVRGRGPELGIGHVVVASDSGETALKLWEALRGSGVKIVSVAEHAGYAGGDEPSIGPERIRELDRRFGR